MDARYIMDYTGFELMYEGIRHTTVEKHAEEWQLTAEQVETLKKRLLEEENRVYEYWLGKLPPPSRPRPGGRAPRGIPPPRRSARLATPARSKASCTARSSVGDHWRSRLWCG